MNRIIKEVKSLNPTFDGVDIRGKLIDVFGSSSLMCAILFV